MSPRQPKTDQQRLPRTKRAKNPPRIQLTERDIEILKAIIKYRFLYLDQIAWLFGPSYHRMATRLRLLYHHGYLDRVKLSVSTSANKMIYAMTEKGAKLLSESLGVGRDEIAWTRFYNQVTASHIAHLLMINNALIAYELELRAAQGRGEVETFKLWRGEPKRDRITVELRNEDGKRYNSAVVPDMVLAIMFSGRRYALFFVEVDRGTMTTRRWQEKIEVYREYMRSPKLQDKYRANSFILLTTTTTDKRIISLAEKTAEMGGRRGFWFTTSGEVSPESALKQIWVRASDLFELRNERLTKLADPAKAPRFALPDSLR
jgi:DNA-binding PadR family transcriptional regulator